MKSQNFPTVKTVHSLLLLIHPTCNQQQNSDILLRISLLYIYIYPFQQLPIIKHSSCVSSCSSAQHLSSCAVKIFECVGIWVADVPRLLPPTWAMPSMNRRIRLRRSSNPCRMRDCVVSFSRIVFGFRCIYFLIFIFFEEWIDGSRIYRHTLGACSPLYSSGCFMDWMLIWSRVGRFSIFGKKTAWVVLILCFLSLFFLDDGSCFLGVVRFVLCRLTWTWLFWYHPWLATVKDSTVWTASSWQGVF